jgi:hypothetical protein
VTGPRIPWALLGRTVAKESGLRGLDSASAEPRQDSDEDPLAWDLTLRFVTGPDGTGAPEKVSPANIRILHEDGTPARGLLVRSVRPGPGGLLVRLEAEDPARAARLARDPRPHLVELAGLPEVDRFLTRASFSFSGTAPTPWSEPLPPEPVPFPLLAEIDYLAKDFQSFRKLMLDRMALSLPQWVERNPVDLGVALVEVLAYAADQLSYHQDAVATESYLATARQRVSVRRHARLLDYFLHEGCNARVWLEVRVAPDSGEVRLPEGTEVLTGDRRPGRIAPESEAHQEAVRQGAQVFQTLHEAVVRPEHGVFQLHAWGLTDYALPPGATTATLEGHWPKLAVGDVLVLRQARTGTPEEADPRRAHPVRLTSVREGRGRGVKVTEIAWHEEDALPFPLWVARELDGQPATRLAEAYGNVVLADHGRTVVQALGRVPGHGRYTPALDERNLIHCIPFDPVAARTRPAAWSLYQDPSQTLPSIVLYELSERLFHRYAAASGGRPALQGAPDARMLAMARVPREPGGSFTREAPRQARFDQVLARQEDFQGKDLPFDVWLPRQDLLSSGRFAREFVVESDEEGRARIRFGDGRNGRAPSPGSRFWAVYRVGSPPRGNVGAGLVTQLVTNELGLLGAHNCVPGRGAVLPEDVETARRNAPQAFHAQRRCVTEEDYARLAGSIPGVSGARCVKTWNGSGVTVVVAVQRPGGRPVDAPFRAAVADFLGPSVLATHELEVRGPELVPLAIVLRIDVGEGQLRKPLRERLQRTLGDGVLEDGRRAFFHPDNFTFGQPVYLGDLIARALSVHGVADAEALEFRRRGQPQGTAAPDGRIAIDRLEVAVCRSLPGDSRFGALELELRGGR